MAFAFAINYSSYEGPGDFLGRSRKEDWSGIHPSNGLFWTDKQYWAHTNGERRRGHNSGSFEEVSEPLLRREASGPQRFLPFFALSRHREI